MGQVMGPNEKTDPETPSARKSSGHMDLKLEDCPKCRRDGFSLVCDCCGGGKKVTHSTAIAWTVANSPESDAPRR